MQPLWRQRQSTSGVFSMAAHSVLQYLPVVVMHEQIGCAHFSAFVIAILYLLPLELRAFDPTEILYGGEDHFCPIRDTL